MRSIKEKAEEAVGDAVAELEEAKTLTELKEIWDKLDRKMCLNETVREKKEELKKKLGEKANKETADEG